MKLSEVVKLWDILHIKDTGELEYCDLEKAIEKITGIEYDIIGNIDSDYIRAFKFAKEKHKGQFDDEGEPYYYHPIQVANIVSIISKDVELQIVALLHDVLEDTDCSYDELKIKFGKNVADLVLELTHEGNKEIGYSFPRLKSKKAILIKFCDRISNLSRMSGWSEKRQSHYLKKSKFWKE